MRVLVVCVLLLPAAGCGPPSGPKRPSEVLGKETMIPLQVTPGYSASATPEHFYEIPGEPKIVVLSERNPAKITATGVRFEFVNHLSFMSDGASLTFLGDMYVEKLGEESNRVTVERDSSTFLCTKYTFRYGDRVKLEMK